MKKMILLCLVFVFSNAIYAQDSKTKVKKEKAAIEKVVKEKKEKVAKVKEVRLKSSRPATNKRRLKKQLRRRSKK